ncbi:MAG: carboxypeptidase-like regulatory domain-containing protein [Bryobacteraceae bacterium]
MVRAIVFFIGIAATLTAADLTGLVVAEHDGSPVVAAAVTLRTGTRVVAELETDDLGHFRASGLPAAEYIVTATKASFTTAERRATLTDAGVDVLLQVAKLGVISGRVTDNQGNGVRNFAVAAVPMPTDGSPLRVYNSRPKGAVTDAAGRYRIFGLPAGDYVVLALAGNARSTADVPNSGIADTSHGNTAEYYPSGKSPAVLAIRSGEQHTNIDLKGYSGPLFNIHGTVTGPSPDTPYRVSLVAEFVGIPLASSTAQPGKEFQFDHVAPGTYKIVASRQIPTAVSNLLDQINSGQIAVNADNQAAIMKQLEAAQTADNDPANKKRIDLAFAETTVTVSQDLNGVTLSARPAVDAKLSYQAPQNCPSSVQLTLTPIEYLGVGTNTKKLEAGVALPLSDLPASAYGVSLPLAESTGCYAVTSLIDFRQVSPGATVPIVVANRGRIQGKITTTGYSPDEFTVVLTTADGISKKTFLLAKDSTFSIPNVLPGRYRLSAIRRTATRVAAADQNIVVESGGTAEVEFPGLP